MTIEEENGLRKNWEKVKSKKSHKGKTIKVLKGKTSKRGKLGHTDIPSEKGKKHERVKWVKQI